MKLYKVISGKWQGKVVLKKELSDKQADLYHPPISMGFVCVYEGNDSDSNYLGWCGVNWFKKHTTLWRNG